MILFLLSTSAVFQVFLKVYAMGADFFTKKIEVGVTHLLQLTA